MTAHKAVIERAIKRLQSTDRFSKKGPPVQVLHDWLKQHCTIAWNDERGLFFVKHPSEGWQVAVWLIDAALEFEPLPNPPEQG